MKDNSKYIAMFIEDSTELLNQMNDDLTSLTEETEDKSETINSLFRGFHSIKGMAATLNFRDIQVVSHKLEDLLEELRSQRLDVSEASTNVMYDGIGMLEKMFRFLEEGKDEEVAYEELVQRILTTMQASAKGMAAPVAPMDETADSVALTQTDLEKIAEQGTSILHIKLTISSDSVSPPARAYLITEMLKEKCEVLKLVPDQDNVEDWDFNKPMDIYISNTQNKPEVEEMIKASIEIEKYSIDEFTVVSASRDGDPKEYCERESVKESSLQTLPKYRKPGAVKVDTPVLDGFIDIVGEMFIKNFQLQDVAKLHKAPKVTESINGLEKLVRKLYKEVMSLRLVSISLLSDIIPRLIRELLSDSDKKVELETDGNDIKLDRSIVEKLGDPVIHMVRNCLDHGIENPQERIDAGKPVKGKLVFTASQSKEIIVIKISDDGRGIDPELIKEKVIAKGMATKEELDEMSDSEIFDFILAPGFSTAATVTDVSGRGVGMDIVKSAVESLNGKLLISSQKGAGTTFTIEVPLTLAIINTFRIKINDDTYALPLGKIVRTIEVPRQDMNDDGGKLSFIYQDETVDVVNLKSVLGISNAGLNGKMIVPILIVESDNKQVGLIVDSFIAGYETVVKPLGLPLEKLEIYSGATMSEKGDIILILDIDKLLKRRERVGA